MKLDGAQITTIVANASVLVGILLLAYELNQNNELARVQAEYSQLQNSAAFSQFVNGNLDVARIWFRSVSNDSLSPLDEARRLDLASTIVEHWQWEFRQLGDDAPIEIYRAVWANAALDSVWPRIRNQFSPSFAQFIDDAIASQPDN